MSVRLIINFTAKPGKGTEMAKIQHERALNVQKEPGCLQFEIFQSVLNPDKVILMELWEDKAALDTHAALGPPAPMPDDVRGDVPVVREDYEYNRTR